MANTQLPESARKFFAKHGAVGGSMSRRKLSPAEARRMVEAREAKRAKQTKRKAKTAKRPKAAAAA